MRFLLNVLIESDWNLKCFKEVDRSRKRYSINRIRLEFKGARLLNLSQSYTVLIESDWNLKIRRYVINRRCILVLIESDWNLKDDPMLMTQPTALY